MERMIGLARAGQAAMVLRVSDAGRVEVTIRLYRDALTAIGMAWGSDADTTTHRAIDSAENDLARLRAAEGEETMLPPKLDDYQRSLGPTVIVPTNEKVKLPQPFGSRRLGAMVATVACASIAAIAIVRACVRIAELMR